MSLFGSPNVDKMLAKKKVIGLIKALDYKKDVGVRQRAAEALGQIDDPRAVAPLIAALHDQEQCVRDAALNVLGDMGERAVKPLIATLKDEDETIRKEAATALGQIGDERAVEPLIATLKDEDEALLMAAVIALGQIGDERAVEPLIAALKHWQQRWQLLDAVRDSTSDLLRAVEAPLITALRDSDKALYRRVRRKLHMQVIITLGRIGSTRAVEPLMAAYKDNDETMRKHAREALKNIGAPDPEYDEFERFSGSGVCDVCNKEIGPGEAYLVPNDTFYASKEYREKMARSGLLFGQSVDDFIAVTKSMDQTAHSAVCSGCKYMFQKKDTI